MAVSKKTVVPIFWNNRFSRFRGHAADRTAMYCNVSSEKMCNVCSHFFFDMEPVVGTFIVSFNILLTWKELEQWAINLYICFDTFYGIYCLHMFPQ